MPMDGLLLVTRGLLMWAIRIRWLKQGIAESQCRAEQHQRRSVGRRYARCRTQTRLCPLFCSAHARRGQAAAGIASLVWNRMI